MTEWLALRLDSRVCLDVEELVVERFEGLGFVVEGALEVVEEEREEEEGGDMEET